jgi:hypothetical protein
MSFSKQSTRSLRGETKREERNGGNYVRVR